MFLSAGILFILISWGSKGMITYDVHADCWFLLLSNFSQTYREAEMLEIRNSIKLGSCKR